MAIGDLVGISTNQGVRAYDNGDGTFTLQVQTTAGVPTTTVITKYEVTTAFVSPAPGASVGDIVQSIQTYNTTTGALISTIWSNVTTSQTLAGAPDPADLAQQATADPYGTQFFAYTANTASGGVSVGDIIQRSISTDLVGGSGISTWYNVSTGLQLTGGSIPPIANLDPITSTAYQVVEAQYNVISAITGGSVGDVLLRYQIVDPTGAPPTVLSTTWYNLTLGTTLGIAPAYGNLTPGAGGGATAANQITEINLLTGITNKLPASLGAKTSAASLSTVLASDATLPLPTGAATSSLQSTGNTLLSTIATDINNVSAQLPTALGPTLSTGSLSVVMSSDATLPLPTGAATAALQTAGNTSLTTVATKTTAIAAQLPGALGQTTSAGSLSTVLASDATLPLPTGASTAALQTTGNTTLSAISGKLPPALGLQSAANSLSVIVQNPTGGNSEVAASALYEATVANPGEYVIGDVLQSVEVYAPGTPSTLIDTIWNNLTQQTVLTVVPPSTDITPITAGGAVSTNIVATSTYAVKTAGSGYAVGDTLQEVIVYDPSGATVITTTWNNLTQGTVLGAAPVYANITASNSQLPPALGPQAAADSLSVYVQNPATGSTSVVNTYTVTTGWTDGAQAIGVGDTVQQILIFNSSGTLTSTVWFDVNLAYTLVAPPPSYSFVTQVTSSTATAANQTTQITQATTTNTTLSTISTQIPTTLGQTTSAGSLSTVLASDATLPLPTGAATAARQDTGNASLASIATQSTITANNTGTIATDTTALRTQLPATLGQAASAASLSTVLASDATLPLPTGAATAANQSTGNTSLATIATQTTNTATSAAAISAQLPPTLGLQLPADSMSVVVANQTSGDVAMSAQYTVVNAWTGAAVGDLVVRYDIYTPGSPPTLVSETWFNITQGTTLAAGPASYSDVTASAGATVTPVLPQVTPALITVTGSGTVAAGAKTISFANTGSGNAIIGAATLPSGASLDFTAPSGSSIAALTYDATGTSLLIATLV